MLAQNSNEMHERTQLTLNLGLDLKEPDQQQESGREPPTQHTHRSIAVVEPSSQINSLRSNHLITPESVLQKPIMSINVVR